MVDKINEDDLETVLEQAHKIEAEYSRDGKRKKAVIGVQAKSKTEAKNKAGVYLSKQGCEVHSVKHLSVEDIVPEGDKIEEGKTYRGDGTFASKVRNNMKKKADKADKERAETKRAVD